MPPRRRNDNTAQRDAPEAPVPLKHHMCQRCAFHIKNLEQDLDCTAELGDNGEVEVRCDRCASGNKVCVPIMSAQNKFINNMLFAREAAELKIGQIDENDPEEFVKKCQPVEKKLAKICNSNFRRAVAVRRVWARHGLTHKPTLTEVMSGVLHALDNLNGTMRTIASELSILATGRAREARAADDNNDDDGGDDGDVEMGGADDGDESEDEESSSSSSSSEEEEFAAFSD
ncbi:MAG: hypothetical protein Q9174_004944 [Haloplaca sp. 1 TL-2023]